MSQRAVDLRPGTLAATIARRRLGRELREPSPHRLVPIVLEDSRDSRLALEAFKRLVPAARSIGIPRDIRWNRSRRRQLRRILRRLSRKRE